MFAQFTFLGRQIGMYAVMAAIGAVLAGLVFCRAVRKRGLDDNDAIIFLLFVAGGVMLGGHILYGLTNVRYFPLLFEKVDFSTRASRFAAIFGGSVFYGGLFGGLIAGSLWIKVMRLDFKLYSDLMAPVAPLFHGVARIGCFLGGCCYGIESKFGFTARGNAIVPEVNDVSRFPVQLLESACNFILAFALFRALKASADVPALKGKLFRIYLISYSCARFAIEFLRGDDMRGFIGVLSTSQFIGAFVFIISLASLVAPVFKKRGLKAE